MVCNVAADAVLARLANFHIVGTRMLGAIAGLRT
jgi:hypothetical protein